MLDHSEAQVIHAELTNVIKIVTHITERLGSRQAQGDTDRRTKDVLQDRIVYLEGELGGLQEENRRLKAANGKLVSQLDAVNERNRLQVVEIEKLIEERDDALERLGKVEAMFYGIFPDKQAAIHTPTPNGVRWRESTGDVESQGKQSERGVSWSSTQVSSRASTPSPSIISGSTQRTVTKARPTSSSAQSSARPSSGEQRHDVTLLCDPEESSGREWYIEREKPPTTASSAIGPFEFRDLVERLGMNTGDVLKLEKKVSPSNRLGARLHIHKNFIFFFDPMWLEVAEHTYLIDWGEKEDHDGIDVYLRRKAKSSTTVFHIFSFPLHKDGWFYLGPHTLQLSDLLDLWKELRQEEKEKYVNKMKIRAQRGKTKRTEEEIIGMAESGKLVQTTIELWGASDRENVALFVEKYRLSAVVSVTGSV